MTFYVTRGHDEVVDIVKLDDDAVSQRVHRNSARVVVVGAVA